MGKNLDIQAQTFWTVSAIAEHLGVCQRTVRRWIDRGELISHSFGRRIRISDTDYHAFLRRHRNGGQDVT